MQTSFTKLFLKSLFLKTLSLTVLVCTAVHVNAQKDSLAKKPLPPLVKTTPKTKDITKLEDVNLPEEMFAKIKAMGPDQLVVFRESYTYNIKAEDKVDYSITVKLGFSQDMITGIVKWTPLYSSNNEAPEIIQIKIPMKFCCTTPIDTIHKKQHCGKMSELNDFEDYEHCKAWKQAEEGGKASDKPAVFNKKGQQVNGKDSLADGFGKGEKLSKKELKKRKETEAVTDSTGAATEKPIIKGKGKKGKEEVKKDTSENGDYGKPMPPSKESKKKKGKEIQAPTENTNYRPEPEQKPAAEEKKKDEQPAASAGANNTPTAKEEKKLEQPKKETSGGFGKVDDKKNKKKKKGKPGEETAANDVDETAKESTPVVDTATSKPTTPATKEEKKVEEVKKDTSKANTIVETTTKPVEKVETKVVVETKDSSMAKPTVVEEVKKDSSKANTIVETTTKPVEKTETKDSSMAKPTVVEEVKKDSTETNNEEKTTKPSKKESKKKKGKEIQEPTEATEKPVKEDKKKKKGKEKDEPVTTDSTTNKTETPATKEEKKD